MTWNNLTEDGKIKSTYLDIDQEMVDGLIAEIESQGRNKYHPTNIKGTMTSYRTTSPHFIKIRPLLKECLGFDCQILDLWGHVLTGLEYIQPHVHSGMYDIENYGSFCYYLDVPEGSGPLYFADYDLEVTPQNKMLVYFDVDVVHEVSPNDELNIRRYTIAGNLKKM